MNINGKVAVVTGASGGMVGASYFVATLPGAAGHGFTDAAAAKAFTRKLGQDALTPVTQRFLFFDLPGAFIPGGTTYDRGLALEEAGVPPAAVQYINYHGTSTELNDRIETRAVKLAFDGHAYRLAGSSIKSLIGHPQGACGAAGVAATLLAMRDSMVPPTINLDEPDPECDLDYVPSPGRRLEIEYAVANCIAFGSKNSALVLRKV